jgi:hypothetical protein
MHIPADCESVITDQKIVLEEKLSKIVIHNRSRSTIRKIRVDGCAIKEGIRCDFLLITDSGCELYIELKGSDVAHAVAQIERTIGLVSMDKRKCNKLSFIISTRCPLLTPKIQEIKVRFKRQYNCSLVIKNRVHEHNL